MPSTSSSPEFDVDNKTDADTSKLKHQILTHMNADHKATLSLYLQHYAGVSSFLSKKPKLLDITLTSLLISHPTPIKTIRSKTLIPFNPPLSTLTEAIARLQFMQDEAKVALQPKVTTVEPPGIIGWLISLGVITSLISFNPYVSRSWIFPKQNNYSSWFTRFFFFFEVWPLLKKLGHEWATVLWVIIFGVHVIESIVMARKLFGFKVRVGSLVFWGWIWWCMVEGWGSLKRVDEVAMMEKGKEEREEIEKED